jgi:hypothetical protein
MRKRPLVTRRGRDAERGLELPSPRVKDLRQDLAVPVARILGDASSLARHLLLMTSVFVLLLACIYVLRILVVLVFSPGEYLRELLALVDTYAVLVGTIGYVTRMSIDMFFLLKQRGAPQKTA